MKLRDHPLMTYKGVSSWPPAWLRRGGYETTHPQGEIGILRNVMPSTADPDGRCFLIMEHCGAEYIGALLLNDPAFCREIFRLLMMNCGETIRDIGEIDISRTL
jgi:hypothetical protein